MDNKEIDELFEENEIFRDKFDTRVEKHTKPIYKCIAELEKENKGLRKDYNILRQKQQKDLENLDDKINYGAIENIHRELAELKERMHKIEYLNFGLPSKLITIESELKELIKVIRQYIDKQVINKAGAYQFIVTLLSDLQKKLSGEKNERI